MLFRNWLFLIAGLLTLAGYWGPWMDHRAAGLVITGLDLGELVKFLPTVRSGAVTVWREGFYWPLVAVSLGQSLVAFRIPFRYPWLGRAAMLAVAVVAALNLLPPAWTPARMMTPEFYLQSGGIALCLAAVAVSPVLALLPHRITAATITLLCGLAIWFPVRDFLRVLPDIAALYNHSGRLGWGLFVMAGGLILFVRMGWTGLDGKERKVRG